ncbi:Histidine kinase CKI1, partial [Bienertia sinuspersici]
MYASKSLANKLLLKKDLYALEMEDGTSLQDHLNKFNGLITQLASLDVKIEEEDKAILLLASLPKKYNSVITSLLVGKTTIALDDTVVALIEAESKIEAGKMQLENKEFNLAQLLEDIADLYHPIAMKKMVEVILDPCDGSIFKFSQVVGDRGKLKQILSNLLSNAVKFTSQGHICIRCRAKKPSLENSIITANQNNFLNRLSRFFHRNKRTYNDLEEMKRIQQDPRSLEFEFEVEDTGIGIPRDKHRSIFEDYIQVKETSDGQVGTGLGLGIVQSLVRLMGGDIEIVDKSNGEQGTCFKFNIFLIIQEKGASPLFSPRQEILMHHRDSTNLRTELSTCARNPSGERSLVIVLIKNEARREMVKRYMQNLGINLKVLNQGTHLHSTLKNIKSKLIEPPQCYNSSSGKSDSPHCTIYLSSSSDFCRDGPKLLPLSKMEGCDDALPVYKRSKVKCILLVVDCNVGDDFQKLQRSVSEFRKDLYMTCTKVVWLDRPDTRRAHFKGLHNDCLPCTDHIMSDPLHGSRLLSIVRLLPEFRGDIVRSSITPDCRRTNTSTGVLQNIITHSETDKEYEPCLDNYAPQQEIQVLRSSSSDKSISRTKITRIGEIQEATDTNALRNAKIKKFPLEGKKILIVEDQVLPKILAEKYVARLGGETQTCENGKEAFEVVCRALSNLPKEGHSKFPYDFILMDCQMDVMDGFEATMKIREEEKKYGVHVMIIALTSHEVDGEEGKKIAKAGMDFHLTKPLQIKDLVNLTS